ncbi:MAG: hypothetical protein ACFFCW_44050 [Candidatus Hodarchaeota archaeon]
MGIGQAERKVYISVPEINPFTKVCDRLGFYFSFMWFGFWRFQVIGNAKNS